MLSLGQAHAEHSWRAASASLIPWVAFLLTTWAAAASVDDESSISLCSVAATAPLYLGFVALPCLLPILMAPEGRMRIAVVVLMTGVAVAAGVQVVASDDAQAGLAVLLVAYVALLLGGSLLTVRVLSKLLKRTGLDGVWRSHRWCRHSR